VTDISTGPEAPQKGSGPIMGLGAFSLVGQPKMADLGQLAAIAISQVGTLEEGGNNRGSKVREYQGATYLAPGDWPWCAAFVCWCIREWLAGVTPSRPQAWRPKTPRAFGFEAWAKERGLPVLPESAAVKAGDIVVFDMSHVGIAVASAPAGSKHVETVEGNTGVVGLRDSAAGDGVFRKKRPRPMIRSIIRLERAA